MDVGGVSPGSSQYSAHHLDGVDGHLMGLAHAFCVAPADHAPAYRGATFPAGGENDLKSHRGLDLTYSIKAGLELIHNCDLGI